MSEEARKPSPVQLVLWATPALVALALTIFSLIVHKGVEIGLGGLLFGILYFIIRIGSFGRDTPAQ
ncbi:hypothetical protein [Ponticaulis profundi]|uniref:Uncharacterized protein n=1 Tax=Ponticaulis profundi TaxID=2665222 RepID=A0ABW1S6P7_9PROT